MTLSHRLEIRQAQSLVMTPQLLQAIRLLQMSGLELTAWLSDELERNPFLEPDTGESAAQLALDRRRAGIDNGPEDATGAGERSHGSGKLDDNPAPQDGSNASADSGYEPDDPAGSVIPENVDGPSGMSLGSMRSGMGGGDAGDSDPLSRIVETPDLRTHLLRQLGAARLTPQIRLVASVLIDAITDAGYLDANHLDANYLDANYLDANTLASGTTNGLDTLAERLGASRSVVEAALAVIQGFDPAGVGARDLAECLAIQLREKDRFDPAMAAMVGRLDLVAKRDMAALRKVCGVDDDDLADMLREVRALEPRPGRPFGATPVTPLVADAIVRRSSTGDWLIELNNDALPRVLVNRAYFRKVSRSACSDAEKSFVNEAWQNASWLNRSLDQRARTILTVATEILRQQEGFFASGAAHLRPMTLKSVAEAIGMHESTISRVTANKSIGCERGVFEMKYFFSAAIAATGDGLSHAAEAVRHRVKQMIDAEMPAAILSDDAIVRMLHGDGVEIARRTVAKYRVSLRIPSSVTRRRLKGAPVGSFPPRRQV